MIANLYLHVKSFKHNGSDTEEMVTEKLRRLLADMRDVVYREEEENKFKVPTELYACCIYKGFTIIEFANKHLNGDEQCVMYSILANCADDYNIQYEELEKKCQYTKEEKEVNSIVVLNQLPEKEDETKRKTQYMQFDKYEIVYNNQSWVTLRRQILGNHPETPDIFIKECRKYFKNLMFHENCIKSLAMDNYLEIIPRKIVYYLSCLNDKFNEIRLLHAEQNRNANDILADFSGKYNLDEPGSLQMNPDKKTNLTFTFEEVDEQGINHAHQILCEPHLKISQEDNNYKGEKVNYKSFHPRIYFCFEHPMNSKQILIGSIGPHL
ncbi:hypothetical protein [Mediterranea massiliensis]|uniref:hypothetical protein n=1 Tax=Mediterranea massiliensis TaxID=1841865 RepID=UPI00266DACE7|nr:hypothetical protein [Mediterranea massiliensis]